MKALKSFDERKNTCTRNKILDIALLENNYFSNVLKLFDIEKNLLMSFLTRTSKMSC